LIEFLGNSILRNQEKPIGEVIVTVLETVLNPE
jgi:hypothetical protein